MLPADRQARLLWSAREHGRVDVTAMSAELAAAPETVRRDLHALELEGLVRRVRGGAVPVERFYYESTISMRAARHVKQKILIAEKAVTYLDLAEVIFIDEGYLPFLIARDLPADRHLTVVTPSLQTALAVSEQTEHTVLAVGGRVRAETSGCTDHWAVRMLDQLTIDVGFLGGNGISLGHGVTVLDSAAAATKRAAMRACRRRILVGDSSKYGRDSLVRFAQLDEFERFITDAGLSDRDANALHDNGIALRQVR